MRSRLQAERRHDRGSATAEVAVALPAVVLVLACCLGALGAAARSAGRGGPVPPGAAVEHRGDLVCVTLARPAGPPFQSITLIATSCAPGAGR